MIRADRGGETEQRQAKLIAEARCRVANTSKTRKINKAKTRRHAPSLYGIPDTVGHLVFPIKHGLPFAWKT